MQVFQICVCGQVYAGARAFVFPGTSFRGSAPLWATSGSSSALQTLPNGHKIKNVALFQSSAVQMMSYVVSLATAIDDLTEVEKRGREQASLRHEYHEIVDDVLSRGWQHFDESESYVISQEESNKMDTENARPSTYGEITPRGVRQLLSHMQLYDGDYDDVVFLDLGSGVGKLVVQVYIEVPTLSQSIGIEMASSRHANAIQAWNSVKDETESLRQSVCGDSNMLSVNNVTLEQGDMFEMDLNDVTHIYISSPCFGSLVMDRLALKLATDTPNLHCVATVHPFPDHAEMFLGQPDIRFVEQTWTAPDVEEVYVYWPGRL
eukprot:scaffold2438_cov167-Amphora_coffeaeformis.AAC.12